MPLPPKNPAQPMPTAQQPVKNKVPPMGMTPGRPQMQRPMQPNMRPAQPMQRPMQTQSVPPQNNVAYAPQNARPRTQPTNNLPKQQPAQPQKLPAETISTKGILVVGIIALLFGVLIGSMLGGGSSPAPQQAVGLRGVVANKDITSKMPRCGLVEKGQPCLLYIMNSTRYDKIAENFFEEAAKLMGVQVYSIGLVNPKYAKELIKPGYIAEIKIPKL